MGMVVLANGLTGGMDVVTVRAWLLWPNTRATPEMAALVNGCVKVHGWERAAIQPRLSRLVLSSKVLSLSDEILDPAA